MVDRISRREFLSGAAAVTLLAGCENRPAARFLGVMRGWNEAVEKAMFSPHRLAPELPPSATTPESAFPEYYISDSIPVAPANWTLKVGGLVRRPTILTLAQILNMPRTNMRVQHHCVEGWQSHRGTECE
jgi:DMSO/TMAO reductase YedYZ molybdopterin-dependent catalytic subunit